MSEGITIDLICDKCKDTPKSYYCNHMKAIQNPFRISEAEQRRMFGENDQDDTQKESDFDKGHIADLDAPSMLG